MALIGRGQITVHIAEKGDPGDKGDPGTPGQPGQPGTSSYLHVRYSANSNGNPMTTTPNTYIGIAVTTSATVPASYTAYAWSQLAGRNGSDGVPGTSQYIHIRYSASSNGNPMITTPNVYIGIAVTTSATAPTSYTGYTWGRLQGETGQPGTPGVSSYLHIRYSANSNGNPMSTTPNTYIGTAVTDVATAPTNYTAYTWQRLTGINGSNGVPGTSQYIHIRYSANASGSPMSTTVNKYIGIAVTTSPTAPTSYTGYTWGRLQGETGQPGTPGVSSYLHIRYSANSNGNPMSTTPNTYIGTTVTDIAAAPTNYTAYTWQRLTGINGSNGVPGTSQYIHIRYSANASGSPMSITVNKYIGIAVTTSPTAPASYTSYTWAQFKGDKGDPGSAGTAGPSVVYQGAFSASTIYYNNTLRRDIVSYSGTYYIYKGTNGITASWNANNWEGFGAQFTSVATDLLLAQLAYINNLGVRNLMTATSGQRIEITAARNSMAFYTAASPSTPVLEIKTTSDMVFMGQGAGFQIKQPGITFSIFKGILHQGSEGSGVSIPVLPWSQPESIAQHAILQSYTNSNTGKYKTGIYIAMSGTQGTATTSDKMNAIHLESGGMFIGGSYSQLRSNNVLCGVTCAGKVSATGSLLRSWVISFMGGYLTASKIATGKYRISFSNTSYLYGADDYHVILLPDIPTGARYACTMARTSSYFEVWTSDDSSTNDSAFTFIVIITNKFW
jgi:hypothetical protein